MEFRVRSTIFIVSGGGVLQLWSRWLDGEFLHFFGLARIGTHQRLAFGLKSWPRLRTMLIAWHNPGSTRPRTTLP